MKRKIGYLIKRIALSHKEYIDDFLKQFDLTTAQFSVLIEVFKAEDQNIQLSQKEIEQRLQISNPTVTGILNRLEAKELIQRVSCCEDRRIRWIHSTLKARSMDKELKKAFDSFDWQLLAGFNEKEIAELLCLLDRAYDNIKHKEGKHG